MRRCSPGRTVWAIALILFVGVVSAGYWAWKMGVLPDLRPPLQVEAVLSETDANFNGIDDSLDIVNGARNQVEQKPTYRSEYYRDGYPPEDEGVCTDLIWRALRNAGYDLKTSIDRDIAAAVSEYPRVSGSPDPNIDFRRVPNLFTFLSRTSASLTTKTEQWNADVAAEWQPGDIVIFGDGYDHIGIISDKRKHDGIPLVIHHGWSHPVEDNALGYWRDKVTGHFRLNLDKLVTR